MREVSETRMMMLEWRRAEAVYVTARKWVAKNLATCARAMTMMRESTERQKKPVIVEARAPGVWLMIAQTSMMGMRSLMAIDVTMKRSQSILAVNTHSFREKTFK